MKDKISIITITYNCKDVIEKTIQSVIHQDYDNKEYIIIDGGSNDGTVDIIKKYESQVDCWVSEKDNGIYDAMNKGILKTTGKWINFMNAGDTFYDHSVLSSVAEIIDSNYTIAYGQIMKIYNRFKFIAYGQPINLNKLKDKCRLPHQGMFTNAEYHKKHLFDISYKSAADYKFYYDAFFNDKCEFQYLPMLIANYDSESGMSKDSHIGTLESYEIQGRNLSENQIRKIILKYQIINFFKRHLPENIKTWTRKYKFSKAGYKIINL
ncbi:MAG: glycosyltransferase [Clostridia bacterium]|nr:glycosyltransferase [Clostridia bacterium]